MGESSLAQNRQEPLLINFVVNAPPQGANEG